MLIFAVISFPLALYKGGVLNHQLSVSINEALRAVESQTSFNYSTQKSLEPRTPAIQIRPRHWLLHHACAFLTKTS